jgi:hypothetical protein
MSFDYFCDANPTLYFYFNSKCEGYPDSYGELDYCFEFGSVALVGDCTTAFGGLPWFAITAASFIVCCACFSFILVVVRTCNRRNMVVHPANPPQNYRPAPPNIAPALEMEELSHHNPMPVYMPAQKRIPIEVLHPTLRAHPEVQNPPIVVEPAHYGNG